MRALLGAACALLLSAMLVACLWPIHAPRNQVAWLPAEDGLAFFGEGTALSNREFEAPRERDASCSLEVWVQPARPHESNTILAFHTAQHPLQLELRQSDTDLDVLRDGAPNPPEWRARHFYAVGAFRPRSPRFITLSSGPKGTAVYINGVLDRVAPHFRISAADCTGRLIVATSPVENDAWIGSLKGLAIYRGELTGAQVLRHYQSWIRERRPILAAEDRCAALYVFREHGGSVVHNQLAAGPDLSIPEVFEVYDQVLLMPFWKGFDIEDIVLNIVGFMPLGFLLCAFLKWGRPTRRTALTVTIAGALISLAIEVAQSYLPTRHSDSMDVISNTLGTWLGVLLYEYAAARGFWRLGRRA